MIFPERVLGRSPTRTICDGRGRGGGQKGGEKGGERRRKAVSDAPRSVAVKEERTYTLRTRERTDDLTHLKDQFLQERRLVGLVEGKVGLHSDESDDGLTSELVGDTDDGSLGDTVVEDEGGFDFGGRETVTRDVDDVVDTAADPV
jgi:hypothetical protein